MSYLAIARKYRPSTFDEMVGQGHVTRMLRNAIQSGRIHHAFLFCGARGVGKTTAARALARSLNCTEGPTAEPCGECVSCKEVTTGTSPDLIEIDGASNNSVDDIRDLRETVNYAPTRGRYKIYLVDEVHMLSKAAFNALLKTLEEPPPHVIFIFATTEPNKILDTILSRVQRFDFKRIGVGPVVERLRNIATAEGATLSDDALRRIARAGEGSMRDSQSLLDKVISFGGSNAISDAEVAETLGLIDTRLLLTMVEGLVEGRPEQCLDAIAEVYEYGFELSQFTGEMLETLRNATLLRLAPGAAKHVDIAAAELEQLTRLVDGVAPEALSRNFSAMLEVHDQVARASRPRIVLEMAVARLATTRPVQPVAALLARLEGLERRIKHSGGDSGPGGMRGGNTRRVPQQSRPPRGGGHRASGVARRAGPSQTAAPPVPEPIVAAMPSSIPVPPPMPEPAESAANPPQPEVDPWLSLATALRALGPQTRRLGEGEAVYRGQTLRIALPAGHALAEARRTVQLDAVRSAVEAHYPPGTRVELTAVDGTGSTKDQEDHLKKIVLKDPALQRVIKALDAKLQSVVKLADGA
ncbi:MAG: DNA polymerase III subunit gamma/tau [Rhodobacterales bacterium]|nr:DNA polymerase III subunit gamma/tau [Rhodobacterales bacterium]